MIVELSITNYALIDHLQVNFIKGLNVLTGETGSGKSIVLGALGLILGSKATGAMIRTGADHALIQAVFDLENCPEILHFLQEKDLGDLEENLTLTRKIQKNGKSICRINGQVVPLGIIKDLSKYLLDVYGQHDYVSLFKVEKQRSLLDRYGGHELLQAKEKTAHLYEQYQQCLQNYQAWQERKQNKAYREELLSFQVNELERANLQEGEEEVLAEEEKVLANAEKIKDLLRYAYLLLYRGELNGKSVLDSLYEVTNTLQELASYDVAYQEKTERIKSLRYELEELTRDLSSQADRMDTDEYRLEAVQKRMYLLHGLKKKYRQDFSGLLNYLQEAKEELKTLTDYEESLAAMEKDLTSWKQSYEDAARQLSVLRQKTALLLEEKITQELQALNMQHAVFTIQFSAIEASKQGMDKIEFYFSPNVGEQTRALSSIASGGELSRVMLALKVILAKIDQIPILVFDEIDTGIGGQTAQIVGEKMALLGQERQVICVTHAPQIASQADGHYLITKVVEAERTKTCIQQLDFQGRVTELSRMLGGTEVTEMTQSYAKELLKKA